MASIGELEHRAVHVLVGRHLAHKLGLDGQLLVAEHLCRADARLHGQQVVLLTLGEMIAVDVQLARVQAARVAESLLDEARLVAVVQVAKGVQELDGYRRQVHEHVELGLGGVVVVVTANLVHLAIVERLDEVILELALDELLAVHVEGEERLQGIVAEAVRGGGENRLRRLARALEEGRATLLLLELRLRLVVDAMVLDEAAIAVRIEVVGEHGAHLAHRHARHRKRAHAREHVVEHVSLVQELDDTLVLGAQSRVPVDLGEVEAERARVLARLHARVVHAGEYLEREVAIRVVDAVHLVHHRLELWRHFVQQSLTFCVFRYFTNIN